MPEWCRWLTPDNVNFLEPGSHNGLNLYAYCGNNPISNYDPSGCWSLSNQDKIAIGLIAIAVGVVITVTTGGAGSPALIAGVKTALAIGAISAITEAAITGIESVVEGDSPRELFDDVGQATIDGFCDGFMVGGIISGISMSFGSLMKNATGLKIGNTAKSQYGKVNLGYGNPKTNGNTLISFQKKSGKTYFRLDVDAVNMLHMHYGSTKKAMQIHRSGIINAIAGVISGVL